MKRIKEMGEKKFSRKYSGHPDGKISQIEKK